MLHKSFLKFLFFNCLKRLTFQRAESVDSPYEQESHRVYTDIRKGKGQESMAAMPSAQPQYAYIFE
jgi:hypothetical protein